jgi:diketogulonate reductase-like aldo/keto reductase
MILEEKFKLSNGLTIPKIGLGTWFINNTDVIQAVKDAANLGYRHIDTAQAYGNESGVGEGIRTCGVSREEMFVTTKLAAEVKSYAEAVASIDASLKALGLDYIDMMIIHSPKPWAKFLENDRYFEGNLEAWRALEESYKSGKLRSIGVSNFDQPDIENILYACSVKPMVNQILAHISNTPMELIKYCQAKDILVEAYSPFGHGELFKNGEAGKNSGKIWRFRFSVSHPLLPAAWVAPAS